MPASTSKKMDEAKHIICLPGPMEGMNRFASDVVSSKLTESLVIVSLVNETPLGKTGFSYDSAIFVMFAKMTKTYQKHLINELKKDPKLEATNKNIYNVRKATPGWLIQLRVEAKRPRDYVCDYAGLDNYENLQVYRDVFHSLCLTDYYFKQRTGKSFDDDVNLVNYELLELLASWTPQQKSIALKVVVPRHQEYKLIMKSYYEDLKEDFEKRSKIFTQTTM